MYAADNVYPYCTRWLLRGRKAKVNVSSLLAHHHHHHHHHHDNNNNDLDAMYFALRQFPVTTITTASDANHHDKSLLLVADGT